MFQLHLDFTQNGLEYLWDILVTNDIYLIQTSWETAKRKTPLPSLIFRGQLRRTGHVIRRQKQFDKNKFQNAHQRQTNEMRAMITWKRMVNDEVQDITFSLASKAQEETNRKVEIVRTCSTYRWIWGNKQTICVRVFSRIHSIWTRQYT